MNPLLSFFVLLLLTVATLAKGQPSGHSATWDQLRREITATYAGAETYSDRGAVRAVRLRLDAGASHGAGGIEEIVQEEIALFETNYRSSGDLRLLLAIFEEETAAYQSFLRKDGSHKIRATGSARPGGMSGFFDGIRQAFTFQGIETNELPLRLGQASRKAMPILPAMTAEIEEVLFNGLRAYQVTTSGSPSADAVILWVDRASKLLLGSEHVSQQGARHLVVVTTLYKPRRNFVLGDDSFAEISAEHLVYEPTEWQFPSLKPSELLARIQAVGMAGRWGLPHSHVSGFPGRSPAPPPVAETQEPAPAEPAAAPRPVVQQLSQEEMAAVVLIEGETGQGTGFLCRINDASFVVTNLHVLADAKSLRIRNARGANLRVQAVHGARGHDVALIRVDDTPGGLTMAKDVADTRIGDEVVVVGNRLGGGVLTQEAGRILGVGPDRVEVDAKFQPGNSGSPIINTRTGEVIGVATYLQEVSIMGQGRPAVDGDGRPVREVATRWFGYRFDSIQEWERIDWAEWRRQGEVVQRFRENSDLLMGLLRGDRNVYMSDPAFRRIVERFEREIGSARISNDDYARQARQFVNDLINFGRHDLRTLEGPFYDYFRSSVYFETSIPLQLKFRQQLIAYLEERERDYRHFRQMLGR